VFEKITEKRSGEHTRSLVYLAVSAVAQLLLLAALLVAGERWRASATGSAPLVPVRLVRPAPSPAVAPPPPAPRERSPARPRVEPVARSSPLPLVQPREIPQRLPAPADVPEPAAAIQSNAPDDRAGGVEGGTPGGVVGGLPGSQGSPGVGSAEDGPVYPGSGARAPRLADPGCLRESLRLPRDLQGFVSGPIDVRFAIQTDGSVTDLQVLTALPDPRIAEAISRAVSSCRWIVGADVQGRPTWFWKPMRLRFEGG
jgi:periplasmic protein TonB